MEGIEIGDFFFRNFDIDAISEPTSDEEFIKSFEISRA